MEKYVWCTFVSTKEFIIPALTLGENLRQVGSKYPLVIAMTENVYESYAPVIKQMGCIPELISTVEYHEELKEGFLKNHRLLNTASRISVFELIQYEKMVFIDCDILITENVDELFDYPDGSMVSANPEEGGFEGLLVCIPKNHPYGIYRYLITSLPMMTAELFSDLWFPIKSNPQYNLPLMYFYDFEAYMMIDPRPEVKIFHGSQTKFWDMTPEYEFYDTHQREVYMNTYNKVKQRTNYIIEHLYLT